ncbi:hypothetical protein BDR03DRAFT_983723 [Suillus americanus]|nr:hypothetical protein BDR03DRAFT_983723 [Suillus americanus]
MASSLASCLALRSLMVPSWWASVEGEEWGLLLRKYSSEKDEGNYQLDFGLRAQKVLKRLKGMRWVCSEAQNGDEAPEECSDVQKIQKNVVDLLLSPDTVYASGSAEYLKCNSENNAIKHAPMDFGGQGQDMWRTGNGSFEGDKKRRKMPKHDERRLQAPRSKECVEMHIKGGVRISARKCAKVRKVECAKARK